MIRLETYQRDGIRYTRYNELEYPTANFLVEVREYLELRIIQLDHLSGQDMRVRGLLFPDEPYIPKKLK
jgi:hypothetical protein